MLNKKTFENSDSHNTNTKDSLDNFIKHLVHGVDFKPKPGESNDQNNTKHIVFPSVVLKNHHDKMWSREYLYSIVAEIVSNKATAFLFSGAFQLMGNGWASINTVIDIDKMNGAHNATLPMVNNSTSSIEISKSFNENIISNIFVALPVFNIYLLKKTYDLPSEAEKNIKQLGNITEEYKINLTQQQQRYGQLDYLQKCSETNLNQCELFQNRYNDLQNSLQAINVNYFNEENQDRSSLFANIFDKFYQKSSQHSSKLRYFYYAMQTLQGILHMVAYLLRFSADVVQVEHPKDWSNYLNHTVWLTLLSHAILFLNHIIHIAVNRHERTLSDRSQHLNSIYLYSVQLSRLGAGLAEEIEKLYKADLQRFISTNEASLFYKQPSEISNFLKQFEQCDVHLLTHLKGLGLDITRVKFGNKNIITLLTHRDLKSHLNNLFEYLIETKKLLNRSFGEFYYKINPSVINPINENKEKKIIENSHFLETYKQNFAESKNVKKLIELNPINLLFLMEARKKDLEILDLLNLETKEVENYLKKRSLYNFLNFDREEIETWLNNVNNLKTKIKFNKNILTAKNKLKKKLLKQIIQTTVEQVIKSKPIPCPPPHRCGLV
jgi:hypothetical protein